MQIGLSDVLSSKSESTLPTLIVGKHDLSVLVHTIGSLDAARSHMISSEIRGDKGKIIHLIADGSQVSPGDELVRFDPTPYEKEVIQLTEKVSSLQSALEASNQVIALEKNQAEQAIKTAEFNLRVARLELDKLEYGSGPIQLAQYKEEVDKSAEELARYQEYVKEIRSLAKTEDIVAASEIYLAEKRMKELKEKHSTSQRKYESYNRHVLPTSLETSRAKVENCAMIVHQLKNSFVYKIAKAAADAENVKTAFSAAKNKLGIAQHAMEKTVIKAPFAGIAILSEGFRNGEKRKPRVGDSVLQNQPILYLPDISSMVVHTQVREIDLYKVSIGQKCTIRVDAYPQNDFFGEVTFIGAMATSQPDHFTTKSFGVTIMLKSEGERLRPGMTARVTILAAKKDNVLAIPPHALFRNGNTLFCYKKVGDKFTPVSVRTGAGNETHVEIFSGLTEGDVVSMIKPPLELRGSSKERSQ